MFGLFVQSSWYATAVVRGSGKPRLAQGIEYYPTQRMGPEVGGRVEVAGIDRYRNYIAGVVAVEEVREDHYTLRELKLMSKRKRWIGSVVGEVRGRAYHLRLRTTRTSHIS